MSNAEEVARALHDAVERIDAEQPDSVGGPGAWEDVNESTRKVLIAAVRSLLADGIIIAIPAPQVTINVQGSTVSEKTLLEAVQRATRWGR
jgi:hypothetical protein